MRNKTVLTLGAVAALLSLLALLLLGGDHEATLAPGAGSVAHGGPVETAQGGMSAANATPTDSALASRTSAQPSTKSTGVRGIVLDARTSQPLAGVEVLALKQQPSFEPLLNRFRGLMQGGMFTET